MRISDWSSDVCSSDLHRCFKLPEAFFRTDVSSAMQQPRRHDQQVESAILGNLATCLGKRVVVQYVDRQPSYIGMVRRMGPPVPGIDAVKSPRRHELIHKRGTDTAAASDHQGALDAHMLLLPAKIGRAPCRERVCQYV